MAPRSEIAKARHHLQREQALTGANFCVGSSTQVLSPELPPGDREVHTPRCSRLIRSAELGADPRATLRRPGILPEAVGNLRVS